MESISLKRQVAIKAIVTETFKKNASVELQENLKQIDLATQQLEFQAKKALADAEKQKATPEQTNNLNMQIEQERQRLLVNKQDLLNRLSQVGQLEINSEFLQGTVDNYVEIKVGDNLYEKMSNTEVILKDGVVVEIRG